MLTSTLLVTLLFAQADPRPEPAIAVIAHPLTTEKSLDVAAVRAFLLKEATYWSDGTRARPVDMQGSDPARLVCLKRVLQMSAEDLQRHWVNIRYQHGTPPPPRLRPEEIIEYVSSFPGAIGFVDAAFVDPAKVKVLLVIKP